MEKPTSSRGVTMEKQQSFRGVMEKQQSFRGVMEKQQSFRGLMEKQKSFRGFMEKQKSFRIAMERQLSFGGSSERKKVKESPGKRGDSHLHLAARAGNLTRVKEIIEKCESSELQALLSKQNQEGETPLYVASENGHALVVSELLEHVDLQTASIKANNGYDPFHVATKQGHLGKKSFLFSILYILINALSTA